MFNYKVVVIVCTISSYYDIVTSGLHAVGGDGGALMGGGGQRRDAQRGCVLSSRLGWPPSRLFIPRSGRKRQFCQTHAWCIRSPRAGAEV